jgi:uncharacterized protein YggE
MADSQREYPVKVFTKEIPMKQISTIVNTILACALIFILFSVGLPNSKAQAATPAPSLEPTIETACDSARSVQVSGTAVVNVVPDRVLIQLGVQSNGKSPKEVQSKNSVTINQVTKALKTLGVEAKDIATDWYTIEPLYEDYESLRIKGYRINNVVAITLRDVEKTNDVIVGAMQAGANQVVNVEFYTSELRKYRDQAREMATKAAAEKAQALAQAAGTETGCVLTINENTSSYFNGWGWWYGSASNQNLWTQNVIQNAAPAGGGGTPSLDDGPVSLGQISVKAEVGVTFGLK